MANHGDTDDPHSDLLGQTLARVVESLQAVAGVVWIEDQADRIVPLRSVGLSKIGLVDSKEAQDSHDRLLRTMFNTTECLVIPPHSRLPWGSGDDSPRNPTDLLMFIAPLEHDGRRHGLIEIFQRPTGGLSDKTAQRARGHCIEESAAMIAVLLAHQHMLGLLPADAEPMTPERVDAFTRRVHESLDPTAVAFIVANEGRRIIGCDRMSVLVRRRGRMRLEAVSCQESVRRGTRATDAIESVALAVARAQQPIWHPDASQKLSPQIDRDLYEYQRQSRSEAISIVPLERPQDRMALQPLLDDSAAHTPKRGQDPVGVVVAEWDSEVTWSDEIQHRVHIVATHGGIALAHALNHSTVPQRVIRALLNQFTFTQPVS